MVPGAPLFRLDMRMRGPSSRSELDLPNDNWVFEVLYDSVHIRPPNLSSLRSTQVQIKDRKIAITVRLLIGETRVVPLRGDFNVSQAVSESVFPTFYPRYRSFPEPDSLHIVQIPLKDADQTHAPQHVPVQLERAEGLGVEIHIKVSLL